MSHLAPEDLEAIGQHLSTSAEEGISLQTLAQRLGVSLPTARRRLLAWAKAHGLTLKCERVREKARGPATARWFVTLSSKPRAPRRPAFNAAQEAALGLPPQIMSALEPDERLSLQLLAKAGTARTSELAAVVGRTPDRMEGLMRVLRRKLYRLGSPMIDNETLPDGEALFRFVKKEP